MKDKPKWHMKSDNKALYVRETSLWHSSNTPKKKIIFNIREQPLQQILSKYDYLPKVILASESDKQSLSYWITKTTIAFSSWFIPDIYPPKISNSSSHYPTK